MRPGRPIRVGLVGGGNAALRLHIPGFVALPEAFQVVAVADPTERRREQVRLALGLPPEAAYADYRSLLEREEIDLVDVCTPPYIRREIVLAAVEAGKHVLSEKPPATIPAEAAEMVEAAEGRGVTFACSHNYLFLPENRAIGRLLEDEAIGRVELAIQNFLGVVDLPGAAEYLPRWRHDPRAGGGVLMDMLHAVYLAEFYLGGPIRAVNAAVDRRLSSEDGVEDLALCRFEFDHGYAVVNMAWGLGPGGIALMGTQGRILVHYADYGTCSFQPLQEIVVIDASGARREVPIEPRESFRPLLADLAAALTEGRPPLATGRHGLRALEGALGAYASAALDRTVSLPLAPDDPVHRLGLAGIGQLDLPVWSPVRRKRLFGVAS